MAKLDASQSIFLVAAVVFSGAGFLLITIGFPNAGSPAFAVGLTLEFFGLSMLAQIWFEESWIKVKPR